MAKRARKDEFEFDPDATEYSAVNAYALVRCSNLAYKNKDQVRAQIKKWGFPESNFRFFDKGDTEGFAIANDTTAIFAFRGTSSVNDALLDANVTLTNGPLGGLVHQGFARGLNEVALKMQRAMRKLDNGNRSIWFTGHSLGAALATLAVAKRLDTKKPVAGLYTYGSPRVGDKKFRKGFNSRLSNYYRMVYGRDIVTRVAPRALHYTHVGQLATISRDGKISHKGFSETSFLKKVFHSIEALHKLDFSAIEDHKLRTGYIPMLKKRAG